jgi:hypothetical protein
MLRRADLLVLMERGGVDGAGDGHFSLSLQSEENSVISIIRCRFNPSLQHLPGDRKVILTEDESGSDNV